MNRRAVLRGLATGATLPLVGSLLPVELIVWGRDVHAAGADAPSVQAGSSLSDQVRHTVAAVCDRIIPADDTPGAVAAGVPAFIDRMLTEWYDAPERARITDGLESLDRLARSRDGPAFASCQSAQQDALLRELDREGSTHWFGTVKYLTIWGYYTSEIGIVRELQQTQPGRYDGCAPYAPRKRSATSPDNPQNESAS